jgi:hypothetical protein
MSDPETYRRKAEALLRRAAETSNMKDRGRLIDEAMHWHNLALDARDHLDGRINDNAGSDEDERRA